MRQQFRIGILCTAAYGLAVSLFVINGALAQSLSCPDEIDVNAKVNVIVACINELKKQVVPKDSVVAFAKKCPEEGWSPYAMAAGRFILGVGTGPLGKFVGLETPGGVETHSLTLGELPEHSHGILADNGSGAFVPLNTLNLNVALHQFNSGGITRQGNDGDLVSGKRGVVIQPQGQGESFTNMPPYIALYFCRKD